MTILIGDLAESDGHS